MFAYILVLMLVLFLSSVKESRSIAIFIVLYFLIFSAFRGENVGVDTQAYLESGQLSYGFSDFNLLDSHSYELLYNLITVIFHDNGRMIVVFLSAVTIIFYYLASRAFKAKTALAFLFFLIIGSFLFSFNGARQAAAAICVVYGLYFLVEEDKNNWYYLLFVALATTIHFSSISALVLYLIPILYRYAKSKFVVVTLMMLSCIFLVYPIDLTGLIFYLPEDLDYVLNYGDKLTMSLSFNYIGILVPVLNTIASCYLFINNNKGNISRMDFFFAASVIICNIFYVQHVYISRTSYPLTVFIAIYYAYYFTRHGIMRKSTDMIVFFASVILNSLLFIITTLGNSGGVYPYSNIIF